jgi:hypothetical protein
VGDGGPAGVSGDARSGAACRAKPALVGPLTDEELAAAARTDVLSTTSTQQEALVEGYRWATAAAAMLAGGTGAALLQSRHD